MGEGNLAGDDSLRFNRYLSRFKHDPDPPRKYLHGRARWMIAALSVHVPLYSFSAAMLYQLICKIKHKDRPLPDTLLRIVVRAFPLSSKESVEVYGLMGKAPLRGA